MKWYKPDKLEWLSFFALMPFLTTGSNYLLFGDRFLAREVLIGSNIVMYSFGFAGWYTHVSFTHYINSRFGHYTQINRRTNLLLILHLTVMFISLTVYFVGYDYFGFLGYRLDFEKYTWAVIGGFFVTSIATTLWSFKHTILQLKRGVADKEELEEENLITEIEGLRNQVNPHFLFNCLNSVSALIEDDTEKAEQFVDEMSKVYRYLLQNTETGLADLSDEVDFIKSYFYLLKIRYTDSVCLDISVDDKFLDCLLPIHTLQLLVENAVKHNTLDKISPLEITISSEDRGRLVVSNSLQRKTLKIQTSKVGLDNIRNKYRLLYGAEIVVRQDNKRFVVELPLIGKGQAIANGYA